MKCASALLFCLLLVSRCCGYFAASYEELKKTSDLIVIAVALENRDTTNRWFHPNYTARYPVVGVETRFQVLAVLKGEWDRKELVLSHYKWADPNFRLVRAAPGPHAFDPAKRDTYLMFLKKDDDRIVPVLQTDTAGSVKMLHDELSP